MSLKMPHKVWTVLTVLLASGTLAACSSATASKPNTKVSDSVFVADSFKQPAAGPKAVPGKKVLVMSCGQNQETCSVAADAQVAAAKAIGWEPKLVDYASDYDKASSQLRSAIAGKYDGVITYALDCPVVQQAFKEVKAAGIFIVGAEGQNCDKDGYDSIVSYSQGDFPKWFEAFGKKQGEVAIAKAGKNAKIMVVRETDVPNLLLAYNGLVAAINECTTCSVVDTVDFTGADFGAPLEQKISQALVKHPDTTLLTVPYDSVLLASAMPALRSSGKLNSVTVAAAEGQTGVVDLIRSGTLTATGVAIPQGWEGWASVDALNRVFAKAPAASSGIGLMTFDKDHNLPASGGIHFPVDFESTYRSIWGVK